MGCVVPFLFVSLVLQHLDCSKRALIQEVKGARTVLISLPKIIFAWDKVLLSGLPCVAELWVSEAGSCRKALELPGLTGPWVPREFVSAWWVPGGSGGSGMQLIVEVWSEKPSEQ